MGRGSAKIQPMVWPTPSEAEPRTGETQYADNSKVGPRSGVRHCSCQTGDFGSLSYLLVTVLSATPLGTTTGCRKAALLLCAAFLGLAVITLKLLADGQDRGIPRNPVS